MTATVMVKNTNWFQALTLAERLNLLDKLAPAASFPVSDPPAVEAELARWRTKPPFGSADQLSRRLQTANLTETDLARVFASPYQAIAQQLENEEPPHWWQDLQKAFEQQYELPDNLPTFFEDKNKLLTPLQPLIGAALARLQTQVARQIDTAATTLLPFEIGDLPTLLLPNLLDQLRPQLTKSLVLELNIARLQGQLEGDTPTERFDHFIQNLSQPAVLLRLLQEEQPGLARQLMTTLDNWVEYNLQFFSHLIADWLQLKQTFAPDIEVGTLVEVDAGAGDVHRNGRSVIRLQFSSGLYLIYKPRSLSIDRHFQQLLAWLNERGFSPAFRLLKLLDRGSYGWVEFVTAADCKDRTEVERFYERQGAYLALLYALEAIDFHYENLIAAGEQPLLIDLEALFHPTFATTTGDQLPYSVLKVGLLPQRRPGNEGVGGVDLSGLTGGAAQALPQAVRGWQGINTDEMQLGYQSVTLPAGSNQPTLNGAAVLVGEFIPQLKAGFGRFYRFLQTHRQMLLEGPLQAFKEDEVRVIFRSTKVYARLLQESFHPNLLQDGLERERFFDHLWIAVDSQPHLSGVIPAEKLDLLSSNIPFFSTKVAEVAVYDSQDRPTPFTLTQSGWQAVETRLARLDEADLARQLWFIEAAFASLDDGAPLKAPADHAATLKPSLQPTTEEFIGMARQIGDRLVQMAYSEKAGAVSWATLNLVNERDWQVAQVGLDFYDGAPGIIYFLAYLGAVSQEVSYTQVAKAALDTLLTRWQAQPAGPGELGIGVFNGRSGLIYLLSHLAVLWNDPELAERAQEIAEGLSGLIETDRMFDVIGGTAGCLLALLSLHRVRPSATLLELARRCGEHLVANLTVMEQGVGWVNSFGNGRALAGLSHGGAGIALALLELASLTKNTRYRETALQGLEYERSLFSPTEANWPDLRYAKPNEDNLERQSKPRFMVAWCHGAPGIGLSRLRMLPHLGHSADRISLEAEIEIAVAATLKHGFGKNHSLCHGGLGNLELVLEASLELSGTAYSSALEELKVSLLNSIKEKGWLSATPSSLQTPGLMTGLAGIGYGLLRLAAPQQIPALLTLAPAH